MQPSPEVRSIHYRQGGDEATSRQLRLPGSRFAWSAGIPLAFLANYGLNELTMSWWFSYFTGVLPGYDSQGGWWSLAGNGVRWCLALAIWFGTGLALSQRTRLVGKNGSDSVVVHCFRRSAPSLLIGLGLPAALVGGVLYAALDAGENPIVDAERDALVLKAFFVVTAAAGTLAVMYVRDLVRLEITSGRALLRTWTDQYPVLDLQALSANRFVVRTEGFSETYFLAGWFSPRAIRPVGAYALEAACGRTEAAIDGSAQPLAEQPSALPVNREILLAGAAWPWWLAGAAGIVSSAWLAEVPPTPNSSWFGTAASIALSMIAGWLTALTIATLLPSTRRRALNDPTPIRFRMLLADARRAQFTPTLGWVRLYVGVIGCTGACIIGGIALGMAGMPLFAPLMLVYWLLCYPLIFLVLVAPMRVLRDCRTLRVDSTGARLGKHLVTACESVGGAIIVYTGAEPAWLRVLSISRDPAKWCREADAIAEYVAAAAARVDARRATVR